MNDQKRVLTNYFIFCFVAFMGLILFLYYAVNQDKASQQKIVKYTTGWNVSINEKETKNADLEHFVFPVVSTGDHLSIKNKLPQIDFDYPVVRMNYWYSTLRVLIDGVEIYSYGHDIQEKGINVGCGVHFVNIKNYTPGSEIEIILDVYEPRSFSSLQPIYIEPAEDSYKNLFHEKAFILIISLFFTLLGAIGTLVCIFCLFIHKPVQSLIAVAQSSFWLGLVVLYNNDCILLFCSNYPFNSFMEHMSIYCINFSLLIVFILSIAKNKIEKNVAKGMLILFTIFVCVILILNFTRIMHLPASRPVFMVFIWLEVCYAIIVVIKHLIHNKNKIDYPGIGFLSMVICVGLDFLRYFALKFSPIQVSLFRGSLLTVGALIFLSSMLADYFQEIHESELDKDAFEKGEVKENKIIDYVTGVFTREKCAALLKYYEAKPASEYTVISIKMDPEKGYNPELESMEYNESLCFVADTLNSLFSCYGIVSRVEVNSFCILISELTQVKLEELILSFKKILKKETEKNPSFRFYISIGYAVRRETDSAEDTVALSESRRNNEILAISE